MGVPISCSTPPPRSCCSSHPAAGEFPSGGFGGVEPAQGIPIAMGCNPHGQLNARFGGHGPSSLRSPPAPLLPSEEFYSGKEKKKTQHRLQTALMTQRFCWPRFLRRLPGEARGLPNLIPSHGNPAHPAAPASLPLVFPLLFWNYGWGVPDVRVGRLAEGWAGGWGGMRVGESWGVSSCCWKTPRGG